MIYIIDDDEIMAECIKRAIKRDEVKIFTNAIEAMNAIASGELPELIFLDILLDGPDGFTFLNELVSYTDTAKIPIIVVSSLGLGDMDLNEYGVVGILEKDKMMPEEIKKYAERYCKEGH